MRKFISEPITSGMGRPKLSANVAAHHTVCVRLDEADRQRLDALIRDANERGGEELLGEATDASVFRGLIRQAFKARGLELPPRPPSLADLATDGPAPTGGLLANIPLPEKRRTLKRGRAQ